MPSAEDVRAGHAIANWNTQYGFTQAAVTQAHAGVEEALAAAGESINVETARHINAAGAALLQVVNAAEAAPLVGVPDYDGPYRRGLDCYRRAAEGLAVYDATDEHDDRWEGAAALLVQGRQITSKATQYTANLIRRIQEGG